MVSDEDSKIPNETGQDKAARLKRNKAKAARKQLAEHRKEAMRHYHAALKEYEDEISQRNLEDEAKCDRS